MRPEEVRAWRLAQRLDQDASALFDTLDISHALRNDVAIARTENNAAIRAAKQNNLAPLPERLSKRAQKMALAERRKAEPDFSALLLAASAIM